MANDEAPGWDAIQTTFRALYPDVEPLRSGAKRDRSVDARFAIQAWSGDQVWHLTTLGLSELWDKHSEREQVSGWGIEVTMLLRRTPDQTHPPTWPIGLLRQFAEMIDKTKMIPEPGHRVDLQRPLGGHDVDPSEGEALTALAFALDDRLGTKGTIDTPNGSLRFLRAVGVSKTELEGDPMQMHAMLAALEPPNITDPRRLVRA